MQIIVPDLCSSLSCDKYRALIKVWERSVGISPEFVEALADFMFGEGEGVAAGDLEYVHRALGPANFRSETFLRHLREVALSLERVRLKANAISYRELRERAPDAVKNLLTECSRDYFEQRTPQARKKVTA
jgi:hypothetical protein